MLLQNPLYDCCMSIAAAVPGNNRLIPKFNLLVNTFKTEDHQPDLVLQVYLQVQQG